MMKRMFFSLISLFLFTLLYAQQEFRIVCGPYLQQPGETEVTVVWATDRDAVSWVEIAPDDSLHFYAVQRPQYYETFLGKRVIGQLHRVRIGGLEPGTAYRYRIYSREVLDKTEKDVRYGKTVANNVYQGQPFRFRTCMPGKESVHFAVVNDIHEDNGKYEELIKGIDLATLDFMLLNGDMVDKMDSVSRMYEGFLKASSRLFASSVPFYMVRGNHETRGAASESFPALFPTSTGRPYYAFTAGPVFFIVLDGGEDKPDTDIEYCGLADFDAYRNEELEWLKEITAGEAFRRSAVRIAVIHVPPLGSTWHGPLEVQRNFVPVLNEAGIDLMLCGHIHRHEFFPAGTTACRFPVLINSNEHILDIITDRREVYVRMKDRKGAEVKEFRFLVK